MRKGRLSAVKYHLKRNGMEIIRATKTAQQAGAYYVRIQAMARKHQIPLDEEFDEHDTPETKYIVAVDDYLPVATCRLYAIDSERVMLGRIVVWFRKQSDGQRNWAMRLPWWKAATTKSTSMRPWAMPWTTPKRSLATHSPVSGWRKTYEEQRSNLSTKLLRT